MSPLPDNSYNIKDIVAWCKKHMNTAPPSGLRKHELLDYVRGMWNEHENRNLGLLRLTDKTICYENIKYVPYRPDSNWLSTLENEGVAVVPLVDPEVNDRWTTQFKDVFSGCNNFSFEDSSTWNYNNLPPNAHGIFKGHEFAHHQFQWELREECARKIFSKIYDVHCTDLVCSFDTLNISLGRKKKELASWFHHDHNRYVDPQFTSIQGVYYHTHGNINDGGTLCYPHSHKVHEQYAELCPRTGITWQTEMPRVIEHVLYQSHLPQVPTQYEVPPGHIFLFNSKIFHQGLPPQDKTSLRLVSYVSMAPRSYISEDELSKHRKYYQERSSTGHWVFGPYHKKNNPPRTYGNDYPTVTPGTYKISSRLQYRLAGYA